MKHVTIDTSSSTRHSCEEPRGLAGHDNDIRREQHIPKDSLPSHLNGYRTPTIEDYELQNIANGTRGQHQGGLSNNSSVFRLPLSSPGFLGRHSQNHSTSSIAHSILEKLQWRERIRHFTWTFFAMTMATGGIANVLYQGQHHSRGSHFVVLRH